MKVLEGLEFEGLKLKELIEIECKLLQEISREVIESL